MNPQSSTKYLRQTPSPNFNVVFCHKIVLIERNTLNLSVNEAVMSLTLAYGLFTKKQCLNIEIGGGGGVSSKCLNIFCR